MIKSLLMAGLFAGLLFPANKVWVDGKLVEAKVVAGTGSSLNSRSFVLANPTSSSGSPLWRVPAGIEIVGIHILCFGGTSITGKFWEFDSNGAAGEAVDSDIVALTGVSTNDDGAIANSQIALGNYLGWKTAVVTGAVSRVILTIDYR